MKRIFSLIALFAVIASVTSCFTEDMGPVKDHMIISIKLEGQLGAKSVPEVLDSETGRIDVQISTDLCPDLSKVKVEELVISYHAKATVELGGTLDFSSGEAKITVTSESGESRTYTIYNTPFSESFTGKYAVKSTAFLGGVGDPSWGGLELIDPIEYKSWLFTESIEQGYGPQASNDDYLEITLDKVNEDGSTEGTCILYGGVDKKHWNCIYKTEYDLKSTFRTIPVGTSHWKREYTTEGSTITFSDASGKETGVCGILTETTELFKKSETVSKSLVLDPGIEALAFKLKGDYSWPSSDQFTDYTKFVVAPRYLFVRIQKVNDIPAASKTEGSMGDMTVGGNTEPEEPDPDPEDPPVTPDPGDDGISGSYKVANLKVLGGAGTTSFVEVKDKSWMWNSSHTKEYDNILVVKATGKSGDSVTCSVDYQAGADGLYWDYVLIADKNKLGTGDYDLSYNYGQLPHEAATATVNMTDGTATIGGVTCKLLTAGQYPVAVEWAYASGTLTVPDGSIAILFNCTLVPDSSYTWDSSWEYTDFERFMLRPFVYAMIFNKQ